MNTILTKLFEETFQGKNLETLQDLESLVPVNDENEDALSDIENICFKAGVGAGFELIWGLMKFVNNK